MATKKTKSIINRRKKLVRVLKRKWTRPALYTLAMSLIIYMAVSNIILQSKMHSYQSPRFVISRISNDFDETEFMHLLLTVQELKQMPKVYSELIEFVNKPFPAPCPWFLESHLNRMNWAPTAFHIRVKKMFDMYDVYDHVLRLDDTISFLKTEIAEERLPETAQIQVDMLEAERARIFDEEISVEEYEFIKGYGGLILQLRR